MSVHPEDLLLYEFMKPLAEFLQVGEELRVSILTINEIVRKQRGGKLETQ
jgi:plasmid maintenance system antidote protein VapI